MLLPIPEDVLQAQARDRMLDLLLGSLGVSAAAAAASFAAYMVATGSGAGAGTGPARVVLAQGAGVEHGRVWAHGVPPAASDPTDGPALDFTPTGTVPGAATPPQAPRAAPLPDFAVRDVFDDTALVEAHGTLQMVQAGAVIAGAGEVLSIERRDSGWVVVTAGGLIAQRR